jgi:hypothetical protein
MHSRTTRMVLGGMLATAVVLILAAWRLTDLWRDLFVNLAAGLVGAVLTFWVFEIYLREIRRSEGIARKGFEYAEFIKNASRAKERIRILTTFTHLLSDARTRQEFRHALFHALRGNDELPVQLLLLDPFSNAARQRDEDRGPSENVIRLIQDNLVQLFDLCDDPVFRSVEVRIYDLLPPISLFQWDNYASMSFYPRGRSISEADRFELSMNTPLGRFLNDTFESIWKDKKTKRLHEYMRLPIHIMNPLTGEAEEHAVPFVKEHGECVFYMLLNRQHQKWGWSLSEDLPLRVVWKGARIECSVKEVPNDQTGVFERVFHSAVAKYSRFDFQRVMAARAAAAL